MMKSAPPAVTGRRCKYGKRAHEPRPQPGFPGRHAVQQRAPCPSCAINRHPQGLRLATRYNYNYNYYLSVLAADQRDVIDAAPRWKVANATKEALAKIMSGQPGEAVASQSSEARGIISILRGR
jgi:hypothetical protein